MSKRTGALKHTHRYQKINGIWYCSLADCSHYMPLNIANGVLGKSSICFQCGTKFTLDDETMKLDQPICLECTFKNKFEVTDMDQLAHDMGLDND